MFLVLPAAVVVGMFCFWVALFLLALRDSYFCDRNRKPENDTRGNLPSDVPQPQGVTPRDPGFWVLAFFLWPGLLAAWLVDQFRRTPLS
jgi:hypothetical protein